MIIISAIGTVYLITYRGYYPWGPDSWGHLFKSKVLYENFIDGNMYPLYTDLWYNGVQPFRYWAPLCYYIIMFFQIFTKGDVVLAYYFFMILMFILGAFGWILFGGKTKRFKLGIILALIWFFLPDNLSIFIAAGNLPRVTANTFFSYLFYFFWSYLENRNKKSLFGIYFCMIFISLSHLMIAAMTGLTLFIYVMWYSSVNKKYIQGLEIVGTALLGVITTGIWFYPALKGGMLTLNQEAVLEFTKMLTYPITESLNPFFRDRNIEGFYFGVTILFIAIIGFVFSNKKSRVGFGVTLIIFVGTTKAFLPFTSKMPMSQMFWMMRFTPLAMASFFTGLFLWKRIKKKVIIIFIILLCIDCGWGFKSMGYGRPLPEMQKDLELAVNMCTQKVSMLDLSEFGAYPSYYLSYNNENKKISQIYGWAFQGAQTSSNIVSINSAIETEWYGYVLDRSLEMGADTLVVKKDNIKNEQEFFTEATKIGYEKKGETEFSWILKYPVNYTFGTTAYYKGLAIGKYSVNMSYIFPELRTGKSNYIDDYSEDNLLSYSVVYLSGFQFKNKEKAEKIIKNISDKGVKVIVDLTGSDVDVYSSRTEFLGVIAQPVKFQNFIPDLYIGKESYKLSEVPEEYSTWNTIYLQNLDEVEGKAQFEKQILDFLGTKINNNIHFIGFNIPFYALETRDERSIKILENLTSLKINDIPKRDIIKVQIENGKNEITVKAESKNTIIPIANLDSFVWEENNCEAVNNLIMLKDNTSHFKIIYPYFIPGILISFIGVLTFTLSYKFYLKKQIRKMKGVEFINVNESL